MSLTFKLPPTERDFEIYEAVHIAGCSTWSQAEKHEISQTRVRQIICRVVEWLGQVLPPQAKIAREQETHLARQIAADRFQHQLEQITELWDETKESKYAGLRIRLTMAQARLGAVGGRLGGLAADAIDGIPVPAWEGEAPAEPNEDNAAPDPTSSLILHPSECSSPPVGDFSAHDKAPAAEPRPAVSTEVKTPAASITYGSKPAPTNTAAVAEHLPAQPLLTTCQPLPVTELQTSPNQAGMALSYAIPYATTELDSKA